MFLLAFFLHVILVNIYVYISVGFMSKIGMSQSQAESWKLPPRFHPLTRGGFPGGLYEREGSRWAQCDHTNCFKSQRKGLGAEEEAKSEHERSSLPHSWLGDPGVLPRGLEGGLC